MVIAERLLRATLLFRCQQQVGPQPNEIYISTCGCCWPNIIFPTSISTKTQSSFTNPSKILNLSLNQFPQIPFCRHDPCPEGAMKNIQGARAYVIRVLVKPPASAGHHCFQNIPICGWSVHSRYRNLFLSRDSIDVSNSSVSACILGRSRALDVK